MSSPRVLAAEPPYAAIVFDCDSTLSAIEGIDELAREHKAEIAALTERAMRGELALEAVFAARLELIRPPRVAFDELARRYVEHALPHARELCAALQSLGKRVVIVSGGLEPAVRPLARWLGLHADDVHSVGVTFTSDGAYADFDRTSPLARSGGKIDVVRGLRARGAAPLVVIGDGVTDLEAAVAAERFVAFAGVVVRENVVARATHVCRKADLAALLPLLCSAAERDALRTSHAHLSLVRASEVS